MAVTIADVANHAGVSTKTVSRTVTILQKPGVEPITVALRNLAGGQFKDWNMVMAGALIAALPTLLIHVLMGRFFIRGLLAGSIKG